MKTNTTLPAGIFKPGFRLSVLCLCLVTTVIDVKAQTTYSHESFSSLFNGTETAPVNTTFQGSTGTWSAVSTDGNSTIAVKTEVSNTDLKLVVKANNLASVSQNTATSPAIDLSMITCTTKFDFFFDIYGLNLTAGNTGTSIMLQLFDGTGWNTVWSKTASQLFTEYGSNAWGTVGLMISTMYMGRTDFRYRFITQNAAGNTIACSFYIDNPKVINYSCSATAAVGNKVWSDVNFNGMQDANEAGIQGVVVKLVVAPGDTLTTTTDASGVYMFTSLPPAGYKLIFPSVAGMSVTNPDAGNDDLDSDISISQKTVTVFLAANETNTTIDAGFVPAVVLPVRLISFSGAINNRRQAELKWMVADNQTADRFILEKSRDGVEFTPAGVILGTDNNGTEEYSFPDSELISARVFYRLKSVEKNGSSAYSKVLVLGNGAAANGGVEILGNPVTDKITFRYDADKNTNAMVKVYDMAGKMQFSQVLSGRDGMNTVNLALPTLISGGVYIIEVISGNTRNTGRFIKQ